MTFSVHHVEQINQTTQRHINTEFSVTGSDRKKYGPPTKGRCRESDCPRIDHFERRWSWRLGTAGASTPHGEFFSYIMQ